MPIKEYTKQGQTCDNDLQIRSMLAKHMHDQKTYGTEGNRSKNLTTNFQNKNRKQKPISKHHGGNRQQGSTKK